MRRDSQPRLIVRALLALVIPALCVLGFAGPARAESPTEVAEELAEDGVYVGIGRGSIDETALIAAVEEARFEGLRVVVVMPNDPQPSASAFARRIQEASEADAALVFPEEGQLETYVVDDLSGSRIRATERARQLSDPARAVEAFTEELMAENEAGTPAIVGRLINALILFTLIVGAVVAAELIMDRTRKSKPETKAEVGPRT